MAARSKNLEMVRLLTPNAMDLTNPLHIAADHGHLAILQCLLLGCLVSPNLESPV